ncbi:MAG: hypothetical protein HGA54_06165, partial [Actinobacteria bacterium]|nr:hypothetical protein [Actinomycetota bacterium]
QLDETTDYRVVAGLSKDMEGGVKRQERIGFEISNLYDRLEKIEEVEKQVTETQAKFAAQEETLTSTYRAIVTQIQEEIAKTQTKRNELALELPEDLLTRYEKLRASKGGIGAGELIGKHCSVCNVEFHEGEWLRIRKGPTIGTCPACNRLLVVRKEL